MIPYRCPSCNHVGEAPAYAAGRKAKCPKCGQGFRVPGRRGYTTVLLPPPKMATKKQRPKE